MQNAAAIRTVSWISSSVAPWPRAPSTSSVVTLRPLSATAPAIRSSEASFGVIGAWSGSACTCSTSGMPWSSCAAANAACESAQNSHSFRLET